MRKVKTNLEIPEDAYLALATIGYTKKRISLEAKSLLAAHLFERGLLSLGEDVDGLLRQGRNNEGISSTSLVVDSAPIIISAPKFIHD